MINVLIKEAATLGFFFKKKAVPKNFAILTGKNLWC